MLETETPAEDVVSEPHIKRKRFWKKIFLLFGIAVTIYLVYIYWQSHRLSDNEREARAIRTKVAEHVLLDDIEPAVITVTDAEKLRATDTFYQHANNGDKLILWEDKALLYRPSIDRIIDFGVVLRSPSVGAETKAQPLGQ